MNCLYAPLIKDEISSDNEWLSQSIAKLAEPLEGATCTPHCQITPPDYS